MESSGFARDMVGQPCNASDNEEMIRANVRLDDARADVRLKVSPPTSSGFPAPCRRMSYQVALNYPKGVNRAGEVNNTRRLSTNDHASVTERRRLVNSKAGVKELLVISQATGAHGLDIKYAPRLGATGTARRLIRVPS
jgi:hypothetical protein